MREVEVGKGKVLVVRDGSEFYALGNKCSHYSAPLVKGTLHIALLFIYTYMYRA